MSTPEERVAGDLIRRNLTKAKQDVSLLLGYKNREILDVALDLISRLEQELPEATDNQELLAVSPGPESVTASLLREQAKDFGTVYARTISVATLRNLRKRMIEPTHPWFGCTLETEEVEGQPNARAVYLVAPTQEPVD